ncbi:DUF1566 domain-containing protein, partial [Vibrio vulnificus]|uniref:Lcl C-terminal domain-containing protein n=1 Tax=Vibrio vulnificus TaxID=672 RepID=UPI0034E087CF
MNAQSLCGASDWRLASGTGVLSIVHNGRVGPGIVQNYFPHTPQAGWYWSSSPNADNSGNAWLDDFNYGSDVGHYKDYSN